MATGYSSCPVCGWHKGCADKCLCPEPFSLQALPKEQADGIARTIFPYIVSFFQVPENQARFEEWLVEYEKKKLAKSEALMQAT